MSTPQPATSTAKPTQKRNVHSSRLVDPVVTGELLDELKQTRPDFQAGGLRDPDTVLQSDLSNEERLGLLAVLRDKERAAEAEGRRARYLEIGVLGGGTLEYLSSRVNLTDFTGVDLFEDWVPDDANTHMSGTFTREGVQDAVGDGITLIKGDFAEVGHELAAKGMRYDLIFIDGDHSYAGVKRDAELARAIAAPGASIGFHNCRIDRDPDAYYAYTDGGPWRLTQELRRTKDWWFELEADRLRVFRVD